MISHWVILLHKLFSCTKGCALSRCHEQKAHHLDLEVRTTDGLDAKTPTTDLTKDWAESTPR